MKKKISIWMLGWFLLIPIISQAQEAGRKWQLGFQLQQLHQDFGLGLNLTIPVLPNRLHLRLSGAQHWLWVEQQGEGEQTNFQTLRLGTTGGWKVGELMQVYGEGGTMLLLSGESLTEGRSAWGGYGLFGFAFRPQEASGTLYLEVGGMTAGTRAKRLPGVPPFGAGLLLSAGFRIPLGF